MFPNVERESYLQCVYEGSILFPPIDFVCAKAKQGEFDFMFVNFIFAYQ